MPRRALALALAAALLAAAARPARATGNAGPAFGVGGGPVSVSSDALRDDGAGGGALHVFGAYRFGDRLSLELAVTGLVAKPATRETSDIFYPEDRAEFSVLDLRLRLDLVAASRGRFLPWFAAGLGLVTLAWQEYFYAQQGVGLSLAAGLDVRVAAGFFLRGAVARVGAGTADNYDYDGPDLSATALLVSAGWQFGWPPLPRGPAVGEGEEPDAAAPPSPEGVSPVDGP